MKLSSLSEEQRDLGSLRHFFRLSTLMSVPDKTSRSFCSKIGRRNLGEQKKSVGGASGGRRGGGAGGT